MSQLRNPFRIRTSERIDSEELFVRLFGPGILELLSADDLWSKIHRIQSAPGAGKTSLLRVFTPEALRAVHAYRAGEEYKDLFRKLKELDAVATTGPVALGARLSCATNYAAIEDMNIGTHQKQRLLFALLDARITLAILRNALILKGLKYPDDLERIRVDAASRTDVPARLPLPCSGTELYEWACSIEREACGMIDSLLEPAFSNIHGTDHIASLVNISAKNLLIDGQAISRHIVVMLDDFHKLTPTQRIFVFKHCCELRPAIGLWIAERLEALSADQLINLGAQEGREYVTIKLEEYWRGSNKTRKYEALAFEIANRRVRSSDALQSGSFSGLLENGPDHVELQERYASSAHEVEMRVSNQFGVTQRYRLWIDETKTRCLNLTPREAAVEWRHLEIVIARREQREQLSLDIPLPVKQLDEYERSGLRAAAEFFLAHENKLPYYFGHDRLVTLASGNVEQFLGISAELFEELIAMKLLKQNIRLNPFRQEIILRKTAKQRFDDIQRNVHNGSAVQSFLRQMGKFAHAQTMRPTAPYCPGVTGIGVPMSERDTLIDATDDDGYRLRHLLSVCIANNLLEPTLDYHQGKKGGPPWMILNFNRLLCLYFGLPLQYGGWRAVKKQQLLSWLDKTATTRGGT